MRPASPNTDQTVRSLLQKAVRRGYSELASDVAKYLYEERGDKAWLRSRTAIITFEECWPLGAEIDTIQSSDALASRRSSGLDSLVSSLRRTAECEKWKGAAGLGTLAYALSQGETDIFDAGTDPEHLRAVLDVAEAIKLDKAKVSEGYWQIQLHYCRSDRQVALVHAAQRAYRRAGWPWDRAFMLAAAYLAARSSDVPTPNLAPTPDAPFDFWVAIDRHTPIGKKALRQVANEVGVSYAQLSWVSFYLESASTNRLTKSFWWTKEQQWRLRRIGLTEQDASGLWARVRPLIPQLQVLIPEMERLTRLFPRHALQGIGSAAEQTTSMGGDRTYTQQSLWSDQPSGESSELLTNCVESDR